MKANENVLHRAARRFLALDCDERDTQRRYALFFCFKFEVFWKTDWKNWDICHAEFISASLL